MTTKNMYFLSLYSIEKKNYRSCGIRFETIKKFNFLLKEVFHTSLISNCNIHIRWFDVKLFGKKALWKERSTANLILDYISSSTLNSIFTLDPHHLLVSFLYLNVYLYTNNHCAISRRIKTHIFPLQSTLSIYKYRNVFTSEYTKKINYIELAVYVYIRIYVCFSHKENIWGGSVHRIRK